MTDTEYRELYPALVRALRRRFPRADGDLIHDAVTGALVDHWQRPWRHDPGRLSLFRYLRMAAVRNLLNLLPGHPAAVPIPPWHPCAVTGRGVDDEVVAAIAARDLIAWVIALARDEDEREVVRWWLAAGWCAHGAGTGANGARRRAYNRLVARLRRARPRGAGWP